MKDDFEYYQGSPDCRRVVQHNGVRTTQSLNRFEVIVDNGTDVWEQTVIQSLREWVKWRRTQEGMREPGDLPK